jgi:hypothetical protein
MNISGLPSTILPAEAAEVRLALQQAMQASADHRRELVAAVVAAHPRSIEGWVLLGDLGRDPIERYAAYRVGYHRGLDALRANGWRGSGYVRWSAESNRGFLRALQGLGAAATSIGEFDEADRIAVFLAQLDPSGVPMADG